MSVPLEDLMKMPCFKNSKLITGIEKAKDTHVEGITIIEAPDIADWIKGGELLLTSFYSIDKDLDKQKNLVEKLREKGAAALIIKTSRFLTTIPREIIDLGNELDFPIIEIPGDTRYIDIMYPVMGEIFNEQVYKLNYYKDCHKEFTDIILNMKGIPSIANTLGRLVENPVIIFDNEFNPIAWNDDKYKRINILEKNIKNLSRNNYPFYGLRVKTLEDEETIHTMIMEPIEVLGNIKGYIGIMEIYKEMEGICFIALESAANVLRFEMLKDVAVTEVELKYKGDLMDDLINNRFDSIENIYDRSNLLGWNLKRHFVVVLISMNQYKACIKNKKNITEELDILRKKVKKIINNISYYYTTDLISHNRGDDIIILWPINKEEELEEIYKSIKQFGQELKKVILNEIGKMTLTIGIGGLSKSPLEIGKSYSEALDAVNFSKRIFGLGSIITFEELGIYKLLCSYNNRGELKKFIHPALLKLKEYDKDKSNELLNTLEMYLMCNLNAVKTAEELFVHYKTVLYRLNRIKEITNLDMENRKNMLEIEVGLKIMKIIE